ncbi:MAG TPA: hypothetical protein VNA21_00075 [Steroidobacteraceae bacterium]|nr:hypothetical protein [Steroidobacteraceae bacterium]
MATIVNFIEKRGDAMSRVAAMLLVVFLMCGTALAHPGHDAPSPHLHALWELVLLVAVVAAFFFIYFVRRRQSKSLKRKAQ